MISPTIRSITPGYFQSTQIKAAVYTRPGRPNLSSVKTPGPLVTSQPPPNPDTFPDCRCFYPRENFSPESAGFNPSPVMMCDAIQTRCAGVFLRAATTEPALNASMHVQVWPRVISLISNHSPWGPSNVFRQNKSQRMICLLQSPHLKSGRNTRVTRNLLHGKESEWGEEKWMDGV